MTETERWVNQTCERIVASGHVRLYRDLYRDLRGRLPCGVACRLLADGLRLTRRSPDRVWIEGLWGMAAHRARAVAALKRLGRYAECREHDAHCASVNNPGWAV